MNRKFVILLIFLVSLFAVSAAAAADNATSDVVSIDDASNDAVDVNENDVVSLEDFNSSISSHEDNVVLNSNEDEVLAFDGNDDVLGASSPPYSWYTVSVSDNTIKYGNSGKISMSITTKSTKTNYYKYDFYLKVYDSNNNEIISTRYYDTTVHSESYSLTAKALDPGIYTIKIINKAESHVMTTANLYVQSVPYTAYTVSVSNTSIGYASRSNVYMTIQSASSSYTYKYDFYFKVYDSKNIEKISQRYMSTSSANSLSYKINANTLSPAVYTIKIINTYDNHVMDTAKLTVVNLPYSVYSASVHDTAVTYVNGGVIPISISPSPSNYKYKYNFYLRIYDSNGKEKANKLFSSYNSDKSVDYNLNSKALDPGTYTIKVVNYDDGHVMSTAKLTVKDIILETQDLTRVYEDVVQYNVRVSKNGSYIGGLNIVFTCNNKQYTAITDDDGYATLKIHLKAGTYSITTKYDCAVKDNTIAIKQKYVANQYKNVKISTQNAYYKQSKKIYYSFEGNLKGSFKIYKGNSLKYSKDFNTNGYIGDYFKYPKHSYSYAVNNLKETGLYTVKIVDSNGKVLAKSTFRINKAPTKSYSESYTTLGGFKDSIWAYNYDNNGNRVGIGGTAKFKIRGKLYKAKVKDGYAKINAKLPSKKKIYKCKVKFSGDKNYKGSTAKFKIKVTKIKNPIKVGKYKIKLTPKQYKKLAKAIVKGKKIKIDLRTGYEYKVKKPYIKTVRKYKTTKSCITLYSVSYLPTMNKMRYNGWQKVSEYTYNVQNPQNKYGIGLSYYTFAVTKWVKVSYKNAYKTKYYPVKAKIITTGSWMGKPNVKIYAHGKTLRNGKVSFG